MPLLSKRTAAALARSAGPADVDALARVAEQRVLREGMSGACVECRIDVLEAPDREEVADEGGGERLVHADLGVPVKRDPRAAGAGQERLRALLVAHLEQD